MGRERQHVPNKGRRLHYPVPVVDVVFWFELRKVIFMNSGGARIVKQVITAWPHGLLKEARCIRHQP